MPGGCSVFVKVKRYILFYGFKTVYAIFRVFLLFLMRFPLILAPTLACGARPRALLFSIQKKCRSNRQALR